MSRRGAKGNVAYTSYQQKRRELALERQKQSRHDKVQQVRSLAHATLQDAPADGSQAMQEVLPNQQHQQQPQLVQQEATAAAGTTSTTCSSNSSQFPEDIEVFGLDGINPYSLSGANLRAYFARQLMQPEWLTDTPSDLATSWLVTPRPEGKRCLVISSRGCTFSRTRTGALLHCCNSWLPGGGPSTAAAGSGCFCVLDCIYQEPALQQQQQQQQQQQLPMQQDSAAAGSSRQWASLQQQSRLHGWLQQLPDQPAEVPNLQQQQQQATNVEAAVAAHGSPQHVATTAAVTGGAGTYYIQDVLAWRGYSLVHCGAEFRLYWLSAKLSEEQGGSSNAGRAHASDHPYRFELLPTWPATPDGLIAAASFGTSGTAPAAATAAAAISSASTAAGMAASAAQHPSQSAYRFSSSSSDSSCHFVQDGLYLRHVEGHYSLGGLTTPLALLWKDESCSRYLLDTDAASVVPEHQQVVLVYQGPNTAGVATADTPPVVLGRLPQQFVQQMGSKLRAGRLLRFSIREGGVYFNPDGKPSGADLAYEGPAHQRRGRADLMSKIMFQWQARRQPVRLQQLIAASAAQAANEQQSVHKGGQDMMMGLHLPDEL